MRQKVRSSIHRLILIVTLFFGTIGCDQTTKVLARERLTWGGSRSYAGGTILLHHVQNQGAFLSLGANLDARLRFWIFTMGAAASLLAGCWFLVRRDQLRTSTTIGLALVLGGGLGNLIDRIWYGSVTDFLNLGIGPVRTGIFNVADVAILVGAFALAFSSGAANTAPVAIETL